MTKTVVRALVREIRTSAQVVGRIAEDEAHWAQNREAAVEALNVIDGDSAMLREHLGLGSELS